MFRNILKYFVTIWVYEMAESSRINLRIPGEWEPHVQTFMVYPASASIWGSKLLNKVRDDIVEIAKAVARFEPVTLIVNPAQPSGAKAKLGSEGMKNISILEMPVNDLWARDTLPVFGVSGEDGEEELVGVDLNFNGWGNKQVHDKDGKLAQRFLENNGIPRVTTKIVGEGGSFEFDGNGTLLVTLSSILNKNRNPEFTTKESIDEALKALFKVQKIIRFKGVYDKDITDAHVDSMVRFAEPGVVVVSKPYHDNSPDEWSQAYDDVMKVLGEEKDAGGNSFKIVELEEPNPDSLNVSRADASSFLSSYVNFLVVNGGVIIPEFGSPIADENAKKILQELYPSREIVGVPILNLATGGGGIHCATHDMPKSTFGGLKSGAERMGYGFGTTRSSSTCCR